MHVILNGKCSDPPTVSMNASHTSLQSVPCTNGGLRHVSLQALFATNAYAGMSAATNASHIVGSLATSNLLFSSRPSHFPTLLHVSRQANFLRHTQKPNHHRASTRGRQAHGQINTSMVMAVEFRNLVRSAALLKNSFQSLAASHVPYSVRNHFPTCALLSPVGSRMYRLSSNLGMDTCT